MTRPAGLVGRFSKPQGSRRVESRYFEISRIGSDRVGSGQEVLKYHGSGRVGSGEEG